ncbi:MAG: cytochrome C biosynthesis protein [Armatimonadota bacterium]
MWLIGLCGLVACILGALALARLRADFVIDHYTEAHRAPRIRPDHADTVIPPNIAPLNFVVQEPGTAYRVEVSSTRGNALTVRSRSPAIVLRLGRWRALLEANRGEELLWDVYVRNERDHWTRFDTITNTIAYEDIDEYLVYRQIMPAYNVYRDMGIYQRNLANYRQSLVLDNASLTGACLNCHTFRDNRTDRMLVSVRSADYGSSALVADDGDITKLDTKFGYAAWHPSGELVAYSLNKVKQFLHAGRAEVRDVVDLDSDVVCYRLESDVVQTTADISEPDRLETYPTWSPDGRYLYYCSAPILWPNRDSIPPEHYDETRYDLRRIRYHIDGGTWGKAETVLSSEKTGLSIVLPRISPDGRWLLFCMCEYGCFPIYQPSSDLYLMDVETREYRRLAINSDRSESWHSWSSNGRWFVFSSKRRDGLFTRSYISYFDEAGRAHEPVILPQEDPTFYDRFIRTYTVPELVTEPVRVSPRTLARAVRSPQKAEVELPVISMTSEQAQSLPWSPAVRERR